ncbi:hscarg dehydrogenase [Colletotrichum truncatum]|uniref:Hscarg dehydrogenase n=1 Tax=Colletotrichum truncatum TaxID=5467 RepID=A0ACC3YJF5_COLTU|nr:hscarg dehydrogenase [Colletotrichum truncatum]KAF6797264.1 hscarg dehydrogenase [Colletotrichum truncatum]
MSKLVTVVGATGIQGGSVIKALLGDDTYNVRAITRDPTSEAASSLRDQGVEVTKADLDDLSSLKKAFSGSYAIFAATNFFQHFPTISAKEAVDIEAMQGLNMATAAMETPTLQHFVWSTLPNASRISNGNSYVPHYAGKNKVDDFIKSKPELLRKTTFLWVAFYASNLQYPFFQPFPIPATDSQKYIQLLPTPPSVPLTLVGDARINVGLFVRAILNQPDKSLPGKFVLGATDTMTAGELLSLWASIKSKKAECLTVDKELYYRLWPKWAQVMHANFMYFDLVRERSYSGEESILTRQDLGIVDLIDTATAIARMGDLVADN